MMPITPSGTRTRSITRAVGPGPSARSPRRSGRAAPATVSMPAAIAFDARFIEQQAGRAAPPTARDGRRGIAAVWRRGSGRAPPRGFRAAGVAPAPRYVRRRRPGTAHARGGGARAPARARSCRRAQLLHRLVRRVGNRERHRLLDPNRGDILVRRLIRLSRAPDRRGGPFPPDHGSPAMPRFHGFCGRGLRRGVRCFA